MLATDTNFESLLEENLKDVTNRSEFDTIKAKRIDTEELNSDEIEVIKINCGTADVITLDGESIDTGELCVGSKEEADGSTSYVLNVDDNTIDMGTNKAVTVNVNGVLNYNGQNLEALIAAGGAGQPINLTHISNESVETHNLGVLGNMSVTKDTSRMPIFSVVHGQNPNDVSRIYMGGQSIDPKITNTICDLIVYGSINAASNVTVNGVLKVNQDIVDSQNVPLMTKVTNAVNNICNNRVNFGDITITGLKKTGDNLLNLGDMTRIVFDVPLQGGNLQEEVPFYSFVDNMIKTAIANSTALGKDNIEFTIKGNLVSPNSITCDTITVNNANGETHLHDPDKIKIHWTRANQAREDTLNKYIEQSVLTDLTSIGKKNVTINFKGSAKVNQNAEITGTLTCNGNATFNNPIDAKANAITCGSLRATQKISVGAGENCYMSCDGGTMICNNFQKYNYKGNKVGTINLGIPDKIYIYDGGKDKTILEYIQDHAPRGGGSGGGIKDCTKIRNYGTALSGGNIYIGNNKVEQCQLLAKQTIFPSAEYIYIYDAKKTLKELLDEAAASGGGGSGGTNCSTSYNFGTITDFTSIWIGNSKVENCFIRTEKISLPKSENINIAGIPLKNIIDGVTFDPKQCYNLGTESAKIINIGNDNIPFINIVSPEIYIKGTLYLQDRYNTLLYIEYDEYNNIGKKKRYTENNLTFDKAVNKVAGEHVKGGITEFGTCSDKDISIGNNDINVFYYSKNLEIGSKSTTISVRNDEDSEESTESITIGDLINAVKGKYTNTNTDGDSQETLIAPGSVTTENATVTGNLSVNTISTEAEDGYINVTHPMRFANSETGETVINYGDISTRSLNVSHELTGKDAKFESISCESLDCDGDEFPVKKKMKFSDPLQDAVMDRSAATETFTHYLGMGVDRASDKHGLNITEIGLFNITFNRVNEYFIIVTGPIHVHVDQSVIDYLNAEQFICDTFLGSPIDSVLPSFITPNTVREINIPFSVKVTHSDNKSYYFPGTFTFSSESMEMKTTEDIFQHWTETNLITAIELIPGNTIISAPTESTLSSYNTYYNVPNKEELVSQYITPLSSN